MLLKSFSIVNDYVHLYFSQNRYLCLRQDNLSGKIFTRNKGGGMIQHPGIPLGIDSTGQRYVIHNHPKVGYAHITTMEDYAQGQKVRLQARICTNSKVDILTIALNAVRERRKYRLFSDNCQTLANSACVNRNYSEDVAKWGGLALGCFLLANAFRKSA